MNVYTTSVKESRVILGSFAYVWELRKAKDLFTSTADKGHPELPVLSATQDRGMIKRDDNGINIFHDKKNEEGYKRVVPGQFVIHLRSFQGGFAHSAIEGITSPAYTVFGFQEPKNHDDNYWKYIFSSKEFIRRLETVTYGIRDGRSISYDEFLTMVFSYPQKEEQARIAAFLDKTTDLITLHQRNPVFLFNLCLFREKIALFNQSDAAAPTWELRKVGELLVERNEQAPMSEEYPLMAFIANEGVAPKGDRYDRSSLVSDTENKVYKKTDFGDFIYSSNNLETGSIGLNKFGKASISPVYSIFQPTGIADSDFLGRRLVRKDFINAMVKWRQGVIYGQWRIHESDFVKIEIPVPTVEEQRQIGAFLDSLDNLITLHQRNPFCLIMEVFNMLNEIRQTDLFCEYYAKWIAVYKKGAIRKVTMDKYIMTHQWLVKLVPHLKIADLNRLTYQQILNDYAMHHERQTTMDFHHQLKGAVLDAVDEGLIERDPTRKAIIKGKTPNIKKIKYINQFELHTLLSSLELKSVVSWDWFILLAAKTGMRFSEALAITPKDFDFAHQTLSISKTWDYKGNGGFLPTKNKSSVRKIQIDWQTVIQFSELVKGFPEKEPIFVTQKVYNSTVNDILARYCKRAKIPVISVHGLRHTHASLLLFAGVSIASVARRLGHASMTTTQKTYLHIIQELENKDVDLVMRSLSGLS